MMSFPIINFEHATKMSGFNPALVICGAKLIWEEDGYEKFINIYQIQHQKIIDDNPDVEWYFYLSGDFSAHDENTDSSPLAVRFEEIYDQGFKFFIDRRGAYIQNKEPWEHTIEIHPKVHDAIIQLNRYINQLTYIDDHGFLCLGEGTCGYGEKDGVFQTSSFDVEIVQEIKDDGMWDFDSIIFQSDSLGFDE